MIDLVVFLCIGLAIWGGYKIGYDECKKKIIQSHKELSFLNSKETQ